MENATTPPFKIRPLFLYKQEPMDATITELMLNLMLMKPGQAKEMQASLETLFVYKVMASRLTHHVGPGIASTQAFAILCAQTTSPGIAVMYAHTLYAIYLKNDKRHVTLGDVMDVFPDGFPREELSKAWDAQKVPTDLRADPTFGGDNALDNQNYWQPQAIEWNHA